jgi:hypothetical protein
MKHCIVVLILICFSLQGVHGSANLEQKQTFPQYRMYKKKAKVFWKWYKKNLPQIQEAIDQHGRSTKVVEHLGKYHPGISALYEKDSTGYHLSFSAGGDIRYIMLVKLLVDQAPKLKSWNFYAFAQAKEELPDSIKHINSVVYAKDIDVYYSIENQEARVAIQLNKRKINEVDELILLQYIQDVVGEYALMRCVHLLGINLVEYKGLKKCTLKEFQQIWKEYKDCPSP